MVSGLVTSPDDQSRICLLDASPMRIASNSLMSIKALLTSFLDLDVCQICLAERPDLGLYFLFRCGGRCDLDVIEVAERLVGRERELAVLVDALLALLELLGGRLPRGRAERARREVDAELLRGAEQLVVLLAHLDRLALVGAHVHVERERPHLL